jgi:uncharacterized protein (UPF0332 family)
LITAFHKEFVNTKIFAKSLGAIFSDLFQKRQACDYDASTCFERDTAIEVLDAAGFFINSVFNFIADKHPEFTTID